MGKPVPGWVKINPVVAQALANSDPVVALESTVITHGLPFPENLELGRQMEHEVRVNGATPATIGIVEGNLIIGLNEAELEFLAKSQQALKISSRDVSAAVTKQESGGTTVAATLFAAHLAGIQVFATGGIGGVHRNAPYDVSADLLQLACTPLVVVCAGAKAILDLEATLEVLETYSVPVVGYQTDEFPAFYSSGSGLPVSVRLDSPREVAQLAVQHWLAGMPSAILVGQPPPEAQALPRKEVEVAIQQALAQCQAEGIRGARVTPYLLKRVSELTGGKSLQANLALLLNNAGLATKIAGFIE
jgi:pseudouridine-5'-phosphate glycosidase